nr:Gag-Pol polyprotein [Tanacetum cinerariifolium]
MALGYQNPSYLKQAQKKQQSLYDGKVLLEKHDPPVVHDSEEILQLAQESYEKMKQLNKEIKPANYTKINHLSGTSVVDTSNLQIELECTKARFETCIIKKENEYAKLWNNWYKKCDECKYDKISYDKAYKNMQQKIERLQAQLENLKVTLNSVPTTQESKVVKNDKVIAPGMFMINHFKTFKEEKHVPNNVRASARTKPITVSQHPVITKKDVNSDSNGLSST